MTCGGQNNGQKGLRIYYSEALPNYFPSAQDTRQKTLLAVTPHALDFISAWTGYNWLSRHLSARRYRRIIPHIDRFIVFDAHTQQALMKYFCIHRNSITIVPPTLTLNSLLQQESNF